MTLIQAPAGTGCSTGEGCGDPILDNPCAAQQHGCGCRESTGECTQKKKSIEVPVDLSGKGPTFCYFLTDVVCIEIYDCVDLDPPCFANNECTPGSLTGTSTALGLETTGNPCTPP